MSREKRTIAGILSLLGIVATTTTVNAAPAAPQGDTGTGTAVTPDGAPPAMAAPAPVRDDAHGAPAAPAAPAAAPAAGETDAATLQAHIAAITIVVDAWRAAEMKTFLGVYDGLLARLLIAVNMKDAARERVELALQMADETGMHFYDAELLRIRAHTYDDAQAHHAGLQAAIELARKQGSPAFELRAAADDFELVGESGRAALEDALSHFPVDQTWPELARARALLR